MSKQCLKCLESWRFEDYQCPCCGSCAVDPDYDGPTTLKYVITKLKNKEGVFEYDVIRRSTKKSVFDEPENYTTVKK